MTDFFNQHPYVEHGDKQTPLLSTLDVIDGLVSAGRLDEKDRLEYRTKLRQAGYIFIPVTEEELTTCLMNVPVSDDEVRETAELRAIRESILHARMGDYLQLPDEEQWLNHTLIGFSRVIRGLWHDDADLRDARARSNWIYFQLDIRGWAHRLHPDGADEIVSVGRARFILQLMTRPGDVDQKVIEAYWEWVGTNSLGAVEGAVSRSLRVVG